MGNECEIVLPLLQLTHVLNMFDFKPPINSQAKSSFHWEAMTWCQPTVTWWRQGKAQVFLWRQRSEVVLYLSHICSYRRGQALCLCTCHRLLWWSGQCQERLESRWHTAESTFKKLLTAQEGISSKLYIYCHKSRSEKYLLQFFFLRIEGVTGW